MPAQYAGDRICRADVQDLLRRVQVREDAGFSQRFPQQMPCRVTVMLRDGRRLVKDKDDYEGFHSRPTTWDTMTAKFNGLSAPYTDAPQRRAIVDAVAHLEDVPAVELMRLLAQVANAVGTE
jgi:2-methylcitrate dehydratase